MANPMDPFDFSNLAPSMNPSPLGMMAQPGSMAPPVQGAPQNPQDLAQRVSGWDAFLKGISTPEASQALLNMGATMLGPRGRGESGAGQIARGLAVGGQSYTAAQTATKEQARKDTLTGLETKKVGLEAQRTQSEADRVKTEQQRADDFHTQTTKQLDLLAEQITKAKADNSPESQALADSLTKADAALKQAQADYYSAGAKAGGAGRDTQAASVQEINNYAAALQEQDPSLTPAAAKIQATERLNPMARTKAPEEFEATLRSNTLQTAAKLFPMAAFDPKSEDAVAQAAWLRDQQTKDTALIEQYKARVTSKPPVPGAGGATAPPAPGQPPPYIAAGTQPGPVSGITPVAGSPKPPDAAAVAQYKSWIQQFPAKKAVIDANWTKTYGSAPPQ